MIENDRKEMNEQRHQKPGINSIPTGTHKYTCNSNIDICIFDILQKYVPFDRVGNVIRSVLNQSRHQDRKRQS